MSPMIQALPNHFDISKAGKSLLSPFYLLSVQSLSFRIEFMSVNLSGDKHDSPTWYRSDSWILPSRRNYLLVALNASKHTWKHYHKKTLYKKKYL